MLREESVYTPGKTPRGKLYNQLFDLLQRPPVFGGAIRDLISGTMPEDMDIVCRNRADWLSFKSWVAENLKRDFTVEEMEITSYRDLLQVKEQAKWEIMERIGGLTGFREYKEAMQNLPRIEQYMHLEGPECVQAWQKDWDQGYEQVQNRFPELVGTPEERKQFLAERRKLYIQHGLTNELRWKIHGELDSVYARRNGRIDNPGRYREEQERLFHEKEVDRKDDEFVANMKRLELKYPRVTRIDRVKKELEQMKLDPAVQDEIVQRLMKDMTWNLSAVRFTILGPQDQLGPRPSQRDDHENDLSYKKQLRDWQYEEPEEPEPEYLVRFPYWCDDEYFQQKTMEWEARGSKFFQKWWKEHGLSNWRKCPDAVRWYAQKPVRSGNPRIFDPKYLAWEAEEPEMPQCMIQLDWFNYQCEDEPAETEYYRQRKEWVNREPEETAWRLSDKKQYKQAHKKWQDKKPFNWFTQDPEKVETHQQKLAEWRAQEPQPGVRVDGGLTDREFLDHQQALLDIKYQEKLEQYQRDLKAWNDRKPDQGAVVACYQEQLKVWNNARREFLDTPESEAYGEKGFQIDVVLLPDDSSSVFDYRCNTLYWDGEKVGSLIDEDPQLAINDILARRAVPVGTVVEHRRAKMEAKGWTVM